MNIGSGAVAICKRSSTRSNGSRMVDDPKDVLTDRNMRPNKESPEDVASRVSSRNATNDVFIRHSVKYRHKFYVESILSLDNTIVESSKDFPNSSWIFKLIFNVKCMFYCDHN